MTLSQAHQRERQPSYGEEGWYFQPFFAFNDLIRKYLCFNIMIIPAAFPFPFLCHTPKESWMSQLGLKKVFLAQQNPYKKADSEKRPVGCVTLRESQIHRSLSTSSNVHLGGVPQ